MTHVGSISMFRSGPVVEAVFDDGDNPLADFGGTGALACLGACSRELVRDRWVISRGPVCDWELVAVYGRRCGPAF